ECRYTAQLGTWNNAVSDVLSGSLIQQSSPVFDTLSRMHVGQEVSISGRFVVSPLRNVDGFEEQSVTEAGSVMSPDYVFHFNNVGPPVADAAADVPVPTSPAVNPAVDASGPWKWGSAPTDDMRRDASGDDPSQTATYFGTDPTGNSMAETDYMFTNG